MKTITIGGGCFWCLEAVYSQMLGVISAKSGYAGGQIDNPSYDAVCSGSTGHAEVVQIDYDENLIGIAQILEVFWEVHDPTTLNRQGNDIGTQYRSVIYYDDEEDLEEINTSMKVAQSKFSAPIVTEIDELDIFYVAENYHQNYFRNNPNQGYCQVVVSPKVDKFKSLFADKVK